MCNIRCSDTSELSDLCNTNRNCYEEQLAVEFIEIQIILKLNYKNLKNKTIIMFNELSYEIIFNICIFMDRQEDLYSFLEAIGKLLFVWFG